MPSHIHIFLLVQLVLALYQNTIPSPHPHTHPPAYFSTNMSWRRYAFVFLLQVREVLMSRRGTLEGVGDSFVDNMARGLDAWTSAAGKDLVRWGYTVLRKD